jgi:hypothetical protein
MAQVLLGGKHGRRAGVQCGMNFVDIGFVKGWRLQRPSKGIAFARTSYLF